MVLSILWVDLVTYSSVVCNGMSRGISLRPRPAQSTVVPSHWHMAGQSESMRHSPDSFMRNSSQEPAHNCQVVWVSGCGGWGGVVWVVGGPAKLRHILFLVLCPTGALTFEFLLAQRFNAPAMHPLRWLTACSTCLYGIFVQIVGQPAQIAVTNERILGQMSIQIHIYIYIKIRMYKSIFCSVVNGKKARK